MIAFDTNYIVRLLIQDDPDQCAEVSATMRLELENGRNIILYDVVLCETLWVLGSAYQASREELLTALKVLRNEPVFAFENPERVETAVKRFEGGKADFADYLILEMGKQNRHSVNFRIQISWERQVIHIHLVRSSLFKASPMISSSRSTATC